jgi:anti-sigma factor RsiW
VTALNAGIGPMSHPATGAKAMFCFMGALLVALVGVRAASVHRAGRPPFVSARGNTSSHLPCWAWVFALGLRARGFFLKGCVAVNVHAHSLAQAQLVTQQG